MHIDTLIHSFKTLKLFGMASVIAELSQQSGPAYHHAEPILDTLIKAEVAEREVRSISYQTKLAKFPAHRDLVRIFTNCEHQILPSVNTCFYQL